MGFGAIGIDSMITKPKYTTGRHNVSNVIIVLVKLL